ncbi:hypothetical protein Acsp07_33400 [Actinomycetospora sp. NBRC 106378]|nr:hypothetical protein Acsp07_33400 [Actinomycetospora sp. NBRC 106378]
MRQTDQPAAAARRAVAAPIPRLPPVTSMLRMAPIIPCASSWRADRLSRVLEVHTRHDDGPGTLPGVPLAAGAANRSGRAGAYVHPVTLGDARPV